MIDHNQAIAETIAVIEAAPESAAALTLYALVNTLEYDRAGRLFKLSKLGDLSADQRQIAYALIESARRVLVADGIEETEQSWILRQNKGMRSMIEAIGMRAAQTFRIYERPLSE